MNDKPVDEKFDPHINHTLVGNKPLARQAFSPTLMTTAAKLVLCI
jgi:hypothetical protein